MIFIHKETLAGRGDKTYVFFGQQFLISTMDKFWRLGGRSMKRLMHLACAVLLTITMHLVLTDTAEAARVAVLPLQFSDDTMERASDFTSYYWDIMVEKLQYPDYELMDDDKVAAKLPEEGLKSFDKATLMDVADKTDADIVIAMRLDKLEERSDFFTSIEPMRRFTMKGEYAGYNRLTGVYYHKNIFEKYSEEEPLTLKNDFQQMTFEDITKRYLYRTLKDNKKKK